MRPAQWTVHRLVRRAHPAVRRGHRAAVVQRQVAPGSHGAV